jgi:hypothetical protein
MKTIKKYSESLIFGLLFIVTIILNILNFINETLLLSIIGSLATIYFGILKLKIENDLLFKELFNSFNDRYDTRFNDLIN